MKRKKFLSTLFASALAVSMLAGYGNVTTFASDDATATEAADSTAETTDETADNEADAEQLMKDLTGTYQELWPVILDDQYKQLWLDDCKELVGDAAEILEKYIAEHPVDERLEKRGTVR